MMFLHKISFYEEDEEGNRTYYTTNEDVDHSLFCDMIDKEDLIQIKEEEA